MLPDEECDQEDAIARGAKECIAMTREEMADFA